MGERKQWVGDFVVERKQWGGITDALLLWEVSGNVPVPFIVHSSV